MKQANTDKVESQSLQQAKHDDNPGVQENRSKGDASISSNEKKGYPAPDEKDKQFSNQEEFIGSQPNKKK